jgi:hypothetical protein
MAEVLFYNHDQKERFFEEREKTYIKIRLIMRTFFNSTREYETQLGKDCSCFTANEIMNMYSSFATRSWEYLLNFNSQLKIYTAWCVKENLVPDNQNHYEEFDKHDIYNCLNLGLKESMVVSRKELEKTLMQVPNVSDQFLMLAFFEGIGGVAFSDFYELGMSNFNGNTVKLNGRELEVSTMLVERAKESVDEYQKYNLEGPLRTGYRIDDPYIVKDSSNAFTDSLSRNTKKIQRRITMLETTYGKAFGYVGLKNSGRIDMIKRFMEQDGSSDIRETYDRHKEEIEIRYGKLQRIYRWVDEYKSFFDDSQ